MAHYSHPVGRAVDAIRQSVSLAIREPITESEHASKLAAARKEWVPVEDLADFRWPARFLAGAPSLRRQYALVVTIADTDEDSGIKVSGELGMDYVRVDMTPEADIHNLIANVGERYGLPDILVNNAGMYPFRPALEMTAEE